jgi:hypothetical protein
MRPEEFIRGLCANCRNAREVRSSTSLFVLCELSATDLRYAKYPRLPVVRCEGFARKVSPAANNAA